MSSNPKFRAKRLSLAALFSLLSFGLSACGFQPLYAERDGVPSLTARLSNIQIAKTNDRATQILRVELFKKLNAGGTPKYRLSLSTRASISDLAIEADSRVTRANYLVNADYVLTHIETGQTVTSGRHFASASYNKVPSEFANNTAEQNARLRGLKLIANDILLNLAIALDENNTHKTTPPAPSTSITKSRQ